MPKPKRPLPYFIDFSYLYRRAEAISCAHESGRLVFLLGAGASTAFHRSFPGWNDLLERLRVATGVEKAEDRKEIRKFMKDGDYLLAAEAIKDFAPVDRDDRDEAVDRAVARLLDETPVEEGDPALHLAVLDFDAPIVTTNFDRIIERVLRDCGEDARASVFTYRDEQEVARRLDPTETRSPYVFKLHGTAGSGGLVLDEGDYADLYFHGRWPGALALLRHLLATNMVVFVGFSLSDPEIMHLLRESTLNAASYQHLALLPASEMTRTRRKVLRSHYRVEPIEYQDHAELPLYLLEMRNFNPRDRLSLKLRNGEVLLRAAQAVRESERLSADCSIVLFGSYAKYGDWIADEADLDLLFLVPDDTETRIAEPVPEADELLGRRIDATVMSRATFEESLRRGDVFASSILETGSPLSDPAGIYALLARGFRAADYHKPDQILNAYEKCRLRWLRVCASRNVEGVEHARACHQWALSVMQLSLIRWNAPQTLLQASLLGNARHAIHQFVQRFDQVDEGFLLDLLRGTKGLPTGRSESWPGAWELVEVFRNALLARGEAGEEERDLLLPRGGLLSGPPAAIARVYGRVAPTLEQVAAMGNSVPGNVERELLRVLDQPRLRASLSTLEWMFFFDLHGRVPHGGELPVAELHRLISGARAEWAWPSVPPGRVAA